MADATPLLLNLAPVSPHVRWFSFWGCVADCGDGRREVRIGGSLVGSFGVEELAARDMIIASLGADANVHLGRLSEAFSLSSEAVRGIRRKYERDGIAGLWNRRPRGRKSPLDAALIARLEGLFEDGLSIAQAQQKVSTRQRKVSNATVGRVRKAWSDRRTVPGIVAGAEVAASDVAQVDLPPVTGIEAVAPDAASTVKTSAASDAVESSDTSTEASAATADELEELREIKVSEPRGGGYVQHVGAWILVAMVARLGLHASVMKAGAQRSVKRPADRIGLRALRIAIDTVLIALAIGERCVEGARRLATPSAPVLLRASHAPTPSWIRRILKRFSACEGAPLLHWKMLQHYMAEARPEDARPAVFYVDNHMRKYTGQATIRRGWRMQDKRALPGTSDYYVNDEDGRPLWRVPDPTHASLTRWLSPIVMHLRLAFGDDEPRLLIAFDRAGSFPEEMAELRDEGIDFVTYERKPYAKLSRALFDEVVTIDGEEVRIHDTRKNLGSGRGRVRRIAMLVAGRQVNVLCTSSLPAVEIITILKHRWRQENGFKHGVERWGINQLDGRKTVPYPADAIVPNPARRRLDRSLRLLKAREGQLRCERAEASTDEESNALQAELVAVAARREKLLALRPSTPMRAPLAETDLAGRLVLHAPEYKTTIDTLRIACANAETDLAVMLAPLMSRPDEAKKLLATLFRAPGRVRVGSQTIGVRLEVAATKAERIALDGLLEQLDELNLTMPGDPKGRRLRVRSQVE